MSIAKLPVFSEDGEKNTTGLVLTDGFPRGQKPARQWFNWLFNSLAKKINELIDRAEPIKVGDVYITTINHVDATAVSLHHGYGAWERTGEGTHLSFAGTSDGVTLVGGAVSGSHTHTITMAQLPAEGVGMQFETAASAGDMLPAVNAFETGDVTGLGMQSDGTVYTEKALQKTQNLGSGQAIPIRPRTTTYYGWVRIADPE